MKIKYIILVIILFIISLTSVIADLKVDAKEIENSIYLDEKAKFMLEIENTDAISKVVQIYTSNVEWYVEIEPFISRLNGNEKVTLELSLLPSAWAKPGPQRVNVFIEASNANEKVNLQLPINVKSYDAKPKEYSPSVELTTEFNQEIDPRKEITLTTYMRNRNYLDIQDMEVVISSNLFSESRLVSLGPLSETTETFTFKLDDYKAPTDTSIEINLRYINRSINRERLQASVIQYSAFEQSIESHDFLFKSVKTFTIHNEGNVNKRELSYNSLSIARAP